MIATPLNKAELENFFDDQAQEVITYFLFKALFAQPEILTGQEQLSLQIPKEHVEQWGVQALGAVPIGAGSYPIDLIDKKNAYGTDIKSLSWSNKKEKGGDSDCWSGETSLAQKFADENLDKKFQDKLEQVIVDEWIKILNNKFTEVSQDYPFIKDFYYFIFIREKDKDVKGDKLGNNFHICGMKIDTTKFSLLKKDRNSIKSVWCKNFLDLKYGQIKVYASKKRMELRLRPTTWVKEKKVITISLKSINSISRDLKLLSKKERYESALGDFKELYKSICTYENNDEEEEN